jgi:hypothetical protein
MPYIIIRGIVMTENKDILKHATAVLKEKDNLVDEAIKKIFKTYSRKEHPEYLNQLNTIQIGSPVDTAIKTFKEQIELAKQFDINSDTYKILVKSAEDALKKSIEKSEEVNADLQSKFLNTYTSRN